MPPIVQPQAHGGPQGQRTLGSAGQAWLDTIGTAGIDHIAERTGIDWHAIREGAIHRLRAGQALWFRFTAAEPGDAERWHLEIPMPR